MSSKYFPSDNVSSNLNGVHMGEVAAVATAAVLDEARRNWTKIGLISLSAVSGASAAVITGVAAFVGYKVIKPARRILHPDTENPLAASADLAPRQQVNFKSADGKLNLNGFFYPGVSSRAGIVVCHGFHGGAVDAHKPALYAQLNGYNVLTFDFRGCGESGGNTTSVGIFEVNDLLGAIEYMKQRPEVDSTRIGLYGFSMGGAVVIQALGVSKDIRAVATDAAFASLNELLRYNFRHFYRLPNIPFRFIAPKFSRMFTRTLGKRIDPVEVLKQMSAEGRQVPLLIIHGQDDKGIPAENAKLLYHHAPGPKYLWIVPDIGHVVARHFDSELYMQRVFSFFNPILQPDLQP